MKVKQVCLSALVLTLGMVGSVRAQDQSGAMSGPSGALGSLAAPTTDPAVVPGSPNMPGLLSSWMAYTRPDCCGPVGGDGPIQSELFFRSGLSLPVSGGIYSHTLTTGYDLEGGGRVLFLNPARDSDWAIDLSISNIANHGQHADDLVLLRNIIVFPPANTNSATSNVGTNVPAALVTVKSLNRTFVNFGGGKDWYLRGSPLPSKDEPAWRIGIDAGGRYGSAKAEFHEIIHRTDTIAGMYVALHTDYEYPLGSAMLCAGVRLECDYTWMDILQIQNNSDLMDVNLLATFGVRW